MSWRKLVGNMSSHKRGRDAAWRLDCRQCFRRTKRGCFSLGFDLIDLIQNR